jgi:maltooligosyltrehalose trehalohydrolase
MGTREALQPLPSVPSDLLGATYQQGHAFFRVWAPHARQVELVIEAPQAQVLPLERSGGYHSGAFDFLPPGTRYKFKVDGEGPYPDPCSRYQPEGPHGPSMLVDPNAYRWSDTEWQGIELRGQVIYELHIGTFTPEGTFDAAIERLEYLRDLGITAIELMPVAESPGRWNWGYDGVQLFAPYHVYGDYDAMKRFVDSAHAHGLAVILDVVYNHLGPDGNYLRCYSRDYFSSAYRTEWGDALNFDGEHSQGVRDFVIGNACYWARDFHIDGFRLDATQSMFDASRPHIIAELIERTRKLAEPRKIVFIAENEPQRSEHLAPPDQGGFGLDAMWNDDFHHTARVALTGRRDGYFQDYTGRSQEFISCLKRGFLYQGQYYHWQKQPRGSLLRGRAPWACVHFLQNHDQVANTLNGTRCHTLASPARFRALTAVTLLGPQTPMIFMGQEFAASSPFTYFADHHPELARLVHQGRLEFLSQFEAYATPSAQRCVPDPAAESTFRLAKLDWSEAHEKNPTLLLHRDLLRLRREDPALSLQSSEFEAATLSDSAFVMRWFDDRAADRLLVVNLGAELSFVPAPEPLLAPPPGHTWRVRWSSEDPRYGGCGAISPVDRTGKPGWNIPAECAVLLIAAPSTPPATTYE